MYMNLKYLEAKGLDSFDWFLLHLVFMNTSIDTSSQLIQYLPEEKLKVFEEKDLVKRIKKKRVKDHDFTTLRLTKKGKNVYRDSQVLDYTEQDYQLLEYLIELYNGVEKSVGNQEQVKKLLSWFRVQTGYSRRMIYIAIRAYIGNLEDRNETKYLPSLENLIWKGQTVFSAKWELSQSKLYQFIQQHKEQLNKQVNAVSKSKG